MSLRERLLRRRGLLFAVPAGALGLLVAVAAFNFDPGQQRARREGRIKDAQELLAPRAASADELAKASGSVTDQTAVSLEKGAWVQVADGEGRLAQQYSATRLEPMPGSQLAMAEPRALIYLRDGRVLALASRKGVAFVPRRALESGTLEEEVEVRLFRPIDGRSPDVERDIPAVVVTADQAQFDGVLGEVRCERAVRVATDAGSFAGEGLSLILDEAGDGIEKLVVDRALEPIRIDRGARALAAKRRAMEGGRDGVKDGVKDSSPASPMVPQPSGEVAGAAGATQTPAAPRFYRLTLDGGADAGGVEVLRVRDGVASSIVGDRLTAVFSLESRGLDDIAFLPSRGPSVGAASRPVLSSLAGAPASTVFPLALAAMPSPTHGERQAATAPDAEADRVTVRFGGKLVMVPVLDAAEQLPTTEDMRFEVTGRRVEAVDGRNGSRIVCSELRYSARDERLEAIGRDDAPLTVSSRLMSLEASRFLASLREGVGRIEGAGRMWLGGETARAVSFFGHGPADIDRLAHMLASASPEASIALPARGATAARIADPARQDIEIAWQEGVDLRFAPDEGGDTESGAGSGARRDAEERDARLLSARFAGGVRVAGREFGLESGALAVAFSETDAEKVDAIVADGGARVRRVGGPGEMRAERLELFLAQDSRGETVPRRLVARTDVEARDDRQVVWTEDLVVMFREADRGAGEQSIGAGAGDGMDGVEIETVTARSGAQVLLSEGARVFAGTLEGDAERRTLRLAGDDVAIVRSNVIMDNLRELMIDEASRSARSDGPGRFRSFARPLLADQGQGKAARPVVPDAAPLDASWAGSLAYSEADARRGVLDLRGDVRVRSKPDGSSSDALDASSVMLELGGGSGPRDGGLGGGLGRRAGGRDGVERDGSSHAADAAADEGARDAARDADRTLERFVAKGGVRLESRAWASAAREGDPRVFRLTGEHVEYDTRTREGLVPGEGGLLVHAPATPGTPAKSPAAIALGADGTTRFRWKDRMALEKQYDDVFRVVMERDVEVLHAGLREGDSFSMRCDAIEAVVRRPLETADGDAGTGAARQSKARGVDLGGPAEMLGLKGRGRIFIRTPTQDIECGEFDYSVATGVATLTAAPGGTVTIALQGQPSPIRAQQVVWDLRSDRIQVLKASGSASR